MQFFKENINYICKVLNPSLWEDQIFKYSLRNVHLSCTRDKHQEKSCRLRICCKWTAWLGKQSAQFLLLEIQSIWELSKRHWNKIVWMVSLLPVGLRMTTAKTRIGRNFCFPWEEQFITQSFPSIFLEFRQALCQKSLPTKKVMCFQGVP